VNPETIDSEYAKLEQEVDATGQAIQAFAQKLQTAAGAGDANAREWLLDLKSIALQVQQDQLQMQSLMQAVHDFTVSHLSDPAYGQPAAGGYPPPQPVYAPQPSYGMQQGMGGGILGRFMGGGFGRAIATGAGFGLGDDLINKIL
jgi:hypothetical protein